MLDLSRLPPLRDVIAAHGLGARKGLGQHFLLDLNLTRRIVRAAGPLGDVHVVEVGPGPGGLTRAVLESDARSVAAIERDQRCVAALEDLVEAAQGRLELVDGDALSIDPADLVPAPRMIIANLPYNISTKLIIQWMGHATAYRRLVVMVQKEVAQRLAAPSGGRDYGRLSVAAQWRCEVHAAFDVPARAFVPPPKVTSTVVVMTPRPVPLAPADPSILEKITAAAFGQRRKMLRASLKSLGHDPHTLLDAAGIAPTLRAENLSIADFCALARAWADLSSG